MLKPQLAAQVEQMLEDYTTLSILIPEAAELRQRLSAAHAWAKRAQQLLLAPQDQALPEQELLAVLQQARVLSCLHLIQQMIHASSLASVDKQLGIRARAQHQLQKCYWLAVPSMLAFQE